MSLRVGVDVQPVTEVEKSLRLFGQRYLERVFDEIECEYALSHPRSAATYLAGRFAARGAVLKLLEVPDVLLCWKDIRFIGGKASPGVLLSGEALSVARMQGISTIFVSVAKGREAVTVVAVADALASSGDSWHRCGYYARCMRGLGRWRIFDSAFVAWLIVITLLFGFSPISRFLLQVVHGSFSPAPYTALSLVNQESDFNGVKAGRPVAVRLSNRTGVTKNYSWSATEKNVVISRGTKFLKTGKSATILIPTRGAKSGTLRIGLDRTDIFVTVSILSPGR